MALLSKDIESLDGLFLHTLRDIYYAEKQIEKALPKMADKASDDGLRQAFRSHLEETHEHVARLDQVFEHIGEKASGVTCPAIDGIIEEAEEISDEIADSQTLDAALAAAAQAVEHYEMSRYGSLVAWARQLGHSESAKILEATLDEEKEADAKLNKVALDRLNAAA
ncbi:ferritin-like domain-containing protein [Roseivivax isoporae]|uniref:Uncharacterized protein n=1 Tax=Roseivivax isoporae LMG 25204 TaxID=1449351 RepID=X7FAB4_9RHOB|nr:ferritin-like domain-containing protein [Roseivivax isoporae]ETX29016.1 hypothetical protein RISW2_03485 [Roseivivax isoporae LMG 25204]